MPRSTSRTSSIGGSDDHWWSDDLFLSIFYEFGILPDSAIPQRCKVHQWLLEAIDFTRQMELVIWSLLVIFTSCSDWGFFVLVSVWYAYFMFNFCGPFLALFSALGASDADFYFFWCLHSPSSFPWSILYVFQSQVAHDNLKTKLELEIDWDADPELRQMRDTNGLNPSNCWSTLSSMILAEF